MRLNILAAAAIALLAFAACTDSTDGIGSSISENVDAINVETATFGITSKSIFADSVLSRNSKGYVGKVRDPETGAYVTGNFMAQFNCLENFSFPKLDSLVAHDANGNEIRGKVKCDSCMLRLFYSDFYGDSTRTMKLTAYEMGKCMNENRNYYSDFDPLDEGYVREDGIHQDKVYALTDYMVDESTRDTSTYEPYITIKLNDPYTDKDGKTYDNYGTYVMQKYYDDPTNFSNSYKFRNNVVPGFYFKHKAGLGSMVYIDASQLDIYYSCVVDDSVVNTVDVFWGTEEVLQKTNISNDKQSLAKLVADESCTYLKTPAGIFTELTLPVDEITANHENDNIAGAQLTIPRINSKTTDEYNLDVPQNVLMIPKDSLYSFFENSQMYNNRNSFLATWSYSQSSSNYSNSYTFNNISGMITAMADVDKAERTEDWNKVVLIPVTLTKTTTSSGSSYSSYYYYYYYGSSSSSSSTITSVAHDMSLTSTRLVKGTTESPIKLNVIYNRFK